MPDSVSRIPRPVRSLSQQALSSAPHLSSNSRPNSANTRKAQETPHSEDCISQPETKETGIDEVGHVDNSTAEYVGMELDNQNYIVSDSDSEDVAMELQDKFLNEYSKVDEIVEALNARADTVLHMKISANPPKNHTRNLRKPVSITERIESLHEIVDDIQVDTDSHDLILNNIRKRFGLERSGSSAADDERNLSRIDSRIRDIDLILPKSDDSALLEKLKSKYLSSYEGISVVETSRPSKIMMDSCTSTELDCVDIGRSETITNEEEAPKDASDATTQTDNGTISSIMPTQNEPEVEVVPSDCSTLASVSRCDSNATLIFSGASSNVFYDKEDIQKDEVAAEDCIKIPPTIPEGQSTEELNNEKEEENNDQPVPAEPLISPCQESEEAEEIVEIHVESKVEEIPPSDVMAVTSVNNDSVDTLCNDILDPVEEEEETVCGSVLSEKESSMESEKAPPSDVFEFSDDETEFATDFILQALRTRLKQCKDELIDINSAIASKIC